MNGMDRADPLASGASAAVLNAHPLPSQVREQVTLHEEEISEVSLEHFTSSTKTLE